MDCRSNILFSNKRVMIIIHTRSDYNAIGDIPALERFNPLRYEVCIYPKSYWSSNWKPLGSFILNEDAYLNNMYYRIKTKIKTKLKIT